MKILEKTIKDIMARRPTLKKGGFEWGEKWGFLGTQAMDLLENSCLHV
jgi:hypothetical protein